MRTLLAAAVLMLGGAIMQAQDPGTEAVQAAPQAAMQTQHLAQQQTQQMNQATADASQNATNCCAVGRVAKPTFSLKAGTYSKTLEVKIRDSSRGAVIYYTTDGWTPTTASTRYTGPVTIDSTTRLQAIAVAPAPFLWRSFVASAQYTFTGTPPMSSANAELSASVPAASRNSDLGQSRIANDRSLGTSVDVIPGLREGTPVHLVFAADVNSKTADVGDKIALTLAEDIKSADAVLVAKGAPAQAVVTEVERTGIGGAPGNIVFQVKTLNANGKLIKLRGGASLEGQPKPANAAVLIPVVGGLTILRHGKDAEIKAGMPITVYVDADTDIALAKPVDEQKNKVQGQLFVAESFHRINGSGTARRNKAGEDRSNDQD